MRSVSKGAINMKLPNKVYDLAMYSTVENKWRVSYCPAKHGKKSLEITLPLWLGKRISFLINRAYEEGKRDNQAKVKQILDIH
jgi:hypothetical protein